VTINCIKQIKIFLAPFLQYSVSPQSQCSGQPRLSNIQDFLSSQFTDVLAFAANWFHHSICALIDFFWCDIALFSFHLLDLFAFETMLVIDDLNLSLLSVTSGLP
jgi:hypothetical protein